MHSGRKSCPDSLRPPLSFRVYVRTFPQMQSGAPVVSPNRNHAPISRKVAVSVVRQAFFRVFRMSFFEEEGVPGTVRWSAFLSCFRIASGRHCFGSVFRCRDCLGTGRGTGCLSVENVRHRPMCIPFCFPVVPAYAVGRRFGTEGNHFRTRTDMRSKSTVTSSSGRMKSMPSAPSSSGNCIESTGRVLTSMFSISQTVFPTLSRNTGSV